MNTSSLPVSTLVNKYIPKNAFDTYTNTKQKRLFIEVIDKIRWTNKLSSQTINLPGKEIQEIQIFEIDLKKNQSISEVLTIINKAIPYHIIFIINYNNQIMLSASQKHPHPTNDHQSVIDWSFSSDWYEKDSDKYQLKLEQSIDHVFLDLCKQLSGVKRIKNKSIADVIQHEMRLKELESSIEKLQSAIRKNSQFNKKVELNLELQKKLAELETLKNL
ncbi:DUF4391 domain-containing protein [Adhaeribacter radiodurans]|uniref:DUF4391 domain-containing protein n=1 Tax=Adhaeribacter radiodurans TaxID=2745197 RepID=A0A7L7LEU3_9BACT|nr:DUF4391 domain-containing protein [Adhaeribacter radiodurans]QMU31368.1 DUF4391 domain-containing protein [Adhaeribacter radiodurans]